MKNYNNSVIYIIEIGIKKYIGSSNEFKHRLEQYNSQFNRLLKNMDFCMSNTALSVKHKYNLSLNLNVIKAFVIRKKWSIRILNYYKCNNEIELRCEEERTRLRRIQQHKKVNILNARVCINHKYLIIDDKRIEYMKTLTEDEREKYNKELKEKELREIYNNEKEKEELNLRRRMYVKKILDLRRANKQYVLLKKPI